MIRRRNKFDMPIGPGAYTRIEDCELDGHIRDILCQNAEAGERGIRREVVVYIFA